MIKSSPSFVALVFRDAKGCFAVIKSIDLKGVDFANTLSQMIRYVRLAFLIHAAVDDVLSEEKISELDSKQKEMFLTFVHKYIAIAQRTVSR